jgi:amino acid transporter
MSRGLPAKDPALVRALGVRGLAASVVNATVGAGIFVLPALVSGGLGAAAPVAFVICAVAMGLIVTSFALAGSRVSLTGGLYAYVEVAFGRYVGFLAGVLLWLAACLAVSSVATALAGSVALILPLVGTGFGRALMLALVFLGLAVINIRGVRAGARTVEMLTVAKLAPLVLFVGVGIFHIQPAAIAWPGWPEADAVGKTVLLLIFAFAGVEVALVPSGEIKNPARTVPRALLLALTVTTLLYMAIQLVAQGVLAGEMSRFADAPLAVAAGRFLGGVGRSIILAGATVSMFGYVSGDMLGSPRTLFAFGRDGFLPAPFARVHPRYRTPHIAIATHAVLAWALSVSSSFEYLALLSNVSLLLLYLLCCAAAWELVRRDVRADGTPLHVPAGRVVCVLASAVILWILSNATPAEFGLSGAVLGLASLLYLSRK